VADNGVVRRPLARGTDEAANRAAARPQSNQKEDGAGASPPEEPGQRIVLDAYDPLPGAILLFVLTAVVHLLLHALGLDATLEVSSRLIRSVSTLIGSVGG
jgi:hypothetical protein